VTDASYNAAFLMDLPNTLSPVVDAGVISTDASRVTVRVISTDKERMIAQSVYRF
jgi:acetate kinase